MGVSGKRGGDCTDSPILRFSDAVCDALRAVRSDSFRSCQAPLAVTALLFLTLIPMRVGAQAPALDDLTRLRQSFQARGIPVEISADQMSYSREQDMVAAEGRVRLSQGTLSLDADRALLYRGTGRVTAEGRISARDGDDTLSADSLELDLTTRSGRISNGRLFLARDHYYITGTRIERLADESYRFEQATITSCDEPAEPGGRVPWKIRARKLRVAPEQSLTARDVVFSVLDVPVVYLPYLIWPVKTERQTGLLPPHVGYSTREGLKVRQPLFITLGGSQDVTVTLDERTQRGRGGALEYRYKLSRRSSGEVEVEVFNDHEEDRVRRRVATLQVIQFSERLELRISGEYLSDETILRDLHEQTADRTKQFVESNLFLTYRDGYQSLTALARYTRDLANPDDDQTQLLPQIEYRLPSVAVAGTSLFLAGQGSYTNFWRRTATSTQRVDAFPVLVWRQAVPPGLLITPRLGVRETLYRSDALAGGDIRRELGVAGLGLAGAVDREIVGRRGGRVRHVVEPAVLYTYIGDPHDEVRPQFDEIDAVAEQNLVTATLTNRVIASGGGPTPESGPWEPLWVRLTQTYRVAHRPDGEAWSPLRGEATFRTRRSLVFDVDAFYDHAGRELVAVDTDASVLFATVADLTLGRRSTRPDGVLPQRGDILDPLALGAVVPGPRTETDYYTILAHLYLPGGVVLANKTYYNRQTRAYTEIAYGILYQAQCWSVSLTYQDLPDRNEVGVLFTLVGATSLDSKFVPGLFDRPTR